MKWGHYQNEPSLVVEVSGWYQDAGIPPSECPLLADILIMYMVSSLQVIKVYETKCIIDYKFMFP